VNFPKPLLPLGDMPIIEVLMKRLVSFGITDITLTLGHLAELIKAYFLHRQEFTSQLRLRYVDEEEPTGTAGSLAFVQGLDDTFLVMNGDVLTDLNYGRLMADHVESGAAATISTHHRDVSISLGVLHFDDDADQLRVTDYSEKPTLKYEVSMGVYCFAPRALGHIPRGERLDFPDLVLKLIAAGETVRGWRSTDFWLDIGRTEDYEQAQEDFETLRDRLLPGDG